MRLKLRLILQIFLPIYVEYSFFSFLHFVADYTTLLLFYDVFWQ